MNGNNSLFIKVDYGLDFIGDVHACYDELLSLLDKLGYIKDAEDLYSHPEGRKLVSLGDVMSRGPKSIESLTFFMNHVESNLAFMIDSNHGWKIARWLDGRKVTLKHGDENVEEEFSNYESKYGAIANQELKKKMRDFLMHAPSHLVFSHLDDERVIAVHAGIKDSYIGKENNAIKNFCRYGDVGGFDEKGKPIRREWYNNHKSKELVIWGHDPKKEPLMVNNTINIDQGAVFGGKLTGFRYPEKEFVFVDAKMDYSGVSDNPII